MVVWDAAVCGVHTTMGSANWEEIRFGVMVPCWVDHRRKRGKEKDRGSRRNLAALDQDVYNTGGL